MMLHAARLTLLVLIVVSSSLAAVECFVPVCQVSSKNAGIDSSPPRVQMATAQGEKGLSEVDEQILFGDSSDNIPFPSPKRHKSRSGNVLESTNIKMNPLDHSPNDPLINKLRLVRDTLTSCPQMWRELAVHCPDHRALFDSHMCDEPIDYSFSQMNEVVRKSAAIFSNLGVEKGVHVAILGENSAYWLVVDHGIQLAGGVSAVRGADAPPDELRYIYEHSNSAGIVVLQGPRLLQKLANDAKTSGLPSLGLENESHGPVKTVILMHREKKTDEDIKKLSEGLGVKVHLFSDLLDKTAAMKENDIPLLHKNDLSTIVYTSGTTGRPKGVMLTHGNLLHQVSHRLAPTKLYDHSEPLPGEKMLSLLPVWHITERTFELWLLVRGCSVVYSSIRTFKNDLAKHKPEWMVLVPRVLEKVAKGIQDKFSSGSAVAKTLVKVFTTTGKLKSKHSKNAAGLVVGDAHPSKLSKLASRSILLALLPINAIGNKLVWAKVKDGFGGKTKVIISGGSALAGALEEFYELCGITVCVGYGLTECSPLIAFRRSDENLVTGGCVGKACMDTELRVVDQEQKGDTTERRSLAAGQTGVVLARGPQIMRGYYKNSEATANAVDKFGWFDTGNLGRINPATGDLILTGRCKDTIVLSNGENIEPSPIEDAILGESSMIEQVMLTEQGGRSLIAIVVLTPNELASAGVLDDATAKRLQKQNEKVNDPKCTAEDCKTGCRALSEASVSLRKNSDLKKTLMNHIRRATAKFRKWEQVGDVFITLEPFAMANGLLTQSYKVKRDAVSRRYENEL